MVISTLKPYSMKIPFSKIDLFLSRSIKIITTGQGLERKVGSMILAYSGGYPFSISGNIRSLPVCLQCRWQSYCFSRNKNLLKFFLIQEKVYFCKYINPEYVKYQDNNKSA